MGRVPSTLDKCPLGGQCVCGGGGGVQMLCMSCALVEVTSGEGVWPPGGGGVHGVSPPAPPLPPAASVEATPPDLAALDRLHIQSFPDHGRGHDGGPRGAGGVKAEGMGRWVLPGVRMRAPFEGGGGVVACGLWCVVLVCSCRRLLADRHSLPFPRTLSLHRRWCPSASHRPLTFLFLLALTLPIPFPFPSLGLSLRRPQCPSASHHSFPSHSLGRLCQRSPRTCPVSLLWGGGDPPLGDGGGGAHLERGGGGA